MAQHAPAAHAHDAHEGGHPTEALFIRIALILAVITLVEVAIYYVDSLSGILVPALGIMSAVKFVTVIGYFMHLKFDDKRLTGIFVGGFVMALVTVLILLALQHYHMPTELVGGKR